MIRVKRQNRRDEDQYGAKGACVGVDIYRRGGKQKCRVGGGGGGVWNRGGGREFRFFVIFFRGGETREGLCHVAFRQLLGVTLFMKFCVFIDESRLLIDFWVLFFYRYKYKITFKHFIQRKRLEKKFKY